MKKILLILIPFFIIGLGAFGYITYQNISNNKVESTIILDINPSVEINLNRKKEVLNVKALNEDAKKIVSSDLKGKKIDNAINIITNNVIENGYAKDDEVTILVSVSGKVKADDIQREIKNSFEEKNLEAKIIIQDISKTAKETAEKYNISISKASYIEEVLKKNNDLTIEDLKDKSISEIEIVKNKEEVTEEQVENKDEGQAQNKETNNSGSTSQSGYSSCTPPGDPSENIQSWCSFNTKRPQWCEYNYPDMKSLSDANSIALNNLGLSNWDTIGNYSSSQQDSRSSYCIANFSIITTKTTRYKVVVDSVTNSIIEVTSEPVPSPKITEEEAIQKSLAYFGIERENCNICQGYYSTNGEPYVYYRYSVSILTFDGEQHATDVNAMTGELKIIY